MKNETVKFKRYEDNCYAVIVGLRRGPCGHDKPTALRAFQEKRACREFLERCPLGSEESPAPRRNGVI